MNYLRRRQRHMLKVTLLLVSLLALAVVLGVPARF